MMHQVFKTKSAAHLIIECSCAHVRPQLVLSVAQLQRPEDATVREELAAAQQLEKLHIARQIGIPGLTIHQHRGALCILTL